MACTLFAGSIGIVSSSIYYFLSISISKEELLKSLYGALFIFVFFMIIITFTLYKIWPQKKKQAERFKSDILPNITTFREYLKLTGHRIIITLIILGVPFLFLIAWLNVHGYLGKRNDTALFMFFLIIGAGLILATLPAIIYYGFKVFKDK